MYVCYILLATTRLYLYHTGFQSYNHWCIKLSHSLSCTVPYVYFSTSAMHCALGHHALLATTVTVCNAEQKDGTSLYVYAFGWCTAWPSSRLLALAFMHCRDEVDLDHIRLWQLLFLAEACTASTSPSQCHQTACYGYIPATSMQLPGLPVHTKTGVNLHG